MKNGFRVEELKTPHCVAAAAAGAMRATEAEGGGRQRGKPNLGVARSLDVVVVVNGGDGDDVNQLHVTLDTSAASGKWSAAEREGRLEDAFMFWIERTQVAEF